MKMLRFEMSNWGRYRDPAIISFDTTPEKNIILIHGLNDRGKTTLFYALRYLLYGARGVLKHTTPSYQKLNAWPNFTSAEKGDGEIFVELKVELDDNQIIRIQRKRKFFQTPPGEEIQLSQNDELTIFNDNGIMDVGKNLANKDDWIQANVLPYDASQFFLFDGEVIQGYMEQPNERVEGAIQQVLGLKELKNAEYDLDDLLNSLRKEITKKSKLNAKDDDMKKMIEQLEIDIKNVYEYLQGLNASKKGAESIFKDCGLKLSKNREIQEKNEKKQELLESVKEDKKTLDHLKIQLIGLRDYAGLLLITPLLRIITMTEETPPSKEQWESKTAAYLLDRKHENCVCETKIDNIISGKLEKKILNLKDNPFSRLKRMVDQITTGFRPDARNVEIFNIINEISDISSRISSNQSAAKSISDEILASGGIGEEVKDLERKQQTASKDITKYEIDITSKNTYLEKQKNKLSNCIQQVSLTTADKELADAIKLEEHTIKIKEVFKETFNRYFTKRKPELEKYISNAFIKLTNNPGMYKAIVLGDDFSIRILRHDGNLLDSYRYSPSPGAAQIAATAMIGGFNKFTTRKAPVFIDTPLARLDPIHKENLLNYYTQISDQVIILPQPDEIDSKEEEIISDFVAQKYQIVDKSGEADASIIIRSSN